MTKKEQIKKWAQKNKDLIIWGGVTMGCACAGWILGEKLIQSMSIDGKIDVDIPELLPSDKGWQFDQLRTDVGIKNVFATVEYEDGDIGIIETVHSVAKRVAEQMLE